MRPVPPPAGLRVKSSPPFLTASGETIMPARSTNVARKGAEGPLSVTFTVAGSTTSAATAAPGTTSYCRNCGRPNGADSKFCTNCGQAL